MRVFGFFLAAAGITTALVFGWTPAKKAEKCPSGFFLEVVDPLSGQDHNANGFTCMKAVASVGTGVQKIGIVGVDDN
jgi:hypothetical protein